MTAEEELMKWGREEAMLREGEMHKVKSAADLAAIQKACRQRRNKIGLSAGQAAWWVRVGQRLNRGESPSFALRS
jgi:hypothetical protein